MSPAWITGWLAVIAIIVSALVPLVQRLRAGRRAAPGSQPIRIHVWIGLATAALSFGHTIVVIPELGSPAATAGGMLALMPGGAAFLLIVAHSGLGLQLRDPKLKQRARVRRNHTITASLIAITVAMHVVVLERAAR